MSTIRADNFANRDGSQSVPAQYVTRGAVKAWTNFNGATSANRNSLNLSSIINNGTGDYTINFIQAMADNNYCPSGHTSGTSFASRAVNGLGSNNGDKASGQLRIITGYANPPGGNFVVENNTTISLIVVGDIP